MKGRRGPLLVLIALGVAIVATIVGILLLTTGGDDTASASSKLDTSFRAPTQYDSLDNVYSEESFSCGSTDSQCVRD